MTMSEVEVDRITQQVFAARNSGLDAALVKVVIDEIEAATTTEAMLATLVERGVLTQERHILCTGCGAIESRPGVTSVLSHFWHDKDAQDDPAEVTELRYATPWEVAS